MQTLKFNLSEKIAVEISGDNALDLWPAAAFWSSLPTTCPQCAAALVLEYTTPKTFKYYKLKCTGQTPHAVNLGQKTDDRSLYFDRSKPWEIFRPGMSEDDHAADRETAQAPAHVNEPTGDKGKLIETIREQYNACTIRRANGYERVDLNKLGGQSVAELERCSSYLAGLLNGNALPSNSQPAQEPAPVAPPVRQSRPDDDIPF